MKSKKTTTKPPRGRPVKRQIKIEATPEQIARAMFAKDKRFKKDGGKDK